MKVNNLEAVCPMEDCDEQFSIPIEVTLKPQIGAPDAEGKQTVMVGVGLHFPDSTMEDVTAHFANHVREAAEYASSQDPVRRVEGSGPEVVREDSNSNAED